MKTKNYALVALLLMLCAIAGSAKKVHTLGDSRGCYNELWQNAKNSVQAGDYVLIQFAHNIRFT